jgi:hypothetical protein
MKIKTSNAIASTLLCVLTATFVTGCEKKNASGVPAPGMSAGAKLGHRTPRERGFAAE